MSRQRVLGKVHAKLATSTNSTKADNDAINRPSSTSRSLSSQGQAPSHSPKFHLQSHPTDSNIIITPAVSVHNDEDLICPMCNTSMPNLAALNAHVDNVHLISDRNGIDTGIDTRNSDGSGKTTNMTTTTSAKVIIPRSHFKKARQGTVCADVRCDNRVGLKHGILNCPKCGDVYCNDHCKVRMKLDGELRVVRWDQPGMWCNCCLRCLLQYYDRDSDITVQRKLTFEFDELRRRKRDEQAMQALVLERRLKKLITWIVDQVKTTGVVSTMRFNHMERELADWENTTNVSECQYCHTRFGMFNRRHHCRVCGDVVCGDYKKGCSMIVPIGVLFNLMSVSMEMDDDVKVKVEQALKIDQLGLRVCMGCKKKVLAKKVFMMDTEKGKHSELMSFQRLWKLLQAKVETEDLTHILDDDENVRLVALFTRLDKLIKDIDKEVNEPNNLQLRRDEIRILQNLKSVIITYVQTKLPILRKAQDEKLARERQGLQNIISDQPKLTKSEIREKREKLMVLNEQRFLVESMYEEFKKQRRFDDLKTLDSNLIDIDTEIEQLTIELGDESFTA